MATEGNLRRFVIVCDVPEIGSKTDAELGSVSKTSCDAIRKVGADQVQWSHSYVAANRTYCVYLATGKEAIRKHAELAGIPITSIEEVSSVIDPTTASKA